MRRRSIRIAATTAVALTAALAPAGAQAAEGGYFAGAAIDGPGIQSVSGLDVARDGDGAVAYVKTDGGVAHVFVARLIDGVWQAPVRIDAALAPAGSQPVIATSDGGRVAVAFANGGAIYTSVATSASTPFNAPAYVGPGRNPAIDMSINGVGYVAYAQPGSPALIRAARLDRTAQAFTPIPSALNIDPARDAGLGDDRPAVAVAADGIATVVWGEAGHVYARRLFELRLSTAPQDLNLAELAGLPGGGADRPDIASEDDSSFAWVVFRQELGGVPRAIARRLVGSQFEAPTIVDGGTPSDVPQIAVNGRGIGYAASGPASGGVFGAVLKDDVMNAAIGIGGGPGVPSLPTAAVDELGDGLIVFQAQDRTIHARPYGYVAATRAVTVPGADALLSNPALGPSSAEDGLLTAADRIGDVAVVFVQGQGAARQLMAGSFDRVPGALRTYPTHGRWVPATPRLRWSASLELWGPVSYEIQIDGRALATTRATTLRLPRGMRDGLRRWRVVAIDRRGQRRTSATRVFRVDATAPRALVTIAGQRRRGAVLRVRVRATDAARNGARRSGIASIRTAWGDGSRSTSGKRPTHRYRHAGTRTIRVTITDVAGNVTVIRRTVRIRG